MGEASKHWSSRRCDQYTIQGDLFSRAILDRQPAPYPLEDSIQNMRILDALVRSVEEKRWVDC